MLISHCSYSLNVGIIRKNGRWIEPFFRLQNQGNVKQSTDRDVRTDHSVPVCTLCFLSVYNTSGKNLIPKSQGSEYLLRVVIYLPVVEWGAAAELAHSRAELRRILYSRCQLRSIHHSSKRDRIHPGPEDFLYQWLSCFRRAVTAFLRMPYRLFCKSRQRAGWVSPAYRSCFYGWNCLKFRFYDQN